MYVGILLREFTLITPSTLVHSFLITLCVAMPGTAQGRGDTDRAGVGRAPPYSYVRSSLHVRRSAGFADGNGSGAFLMEAAGGALGSAAGIGIVALASNCGIDDLACAIKTVGAGGLLGTIGATIGTTIAARQTGSRRSIIGAALGAAVGAAAGVGIHYLLTESGGSNLGEYAVVPIVIVSQGLAAAAGSRLLGR